MDTYHLVEPFDIDDGSLDGLSLQEAFTLGVEWALFWDRLKSGQPFQDLCLANNAQRLEKLAERMGRFSECRQTSVHGWTEVWVGTLISGCEPPEQESR
jgi:hypothetical protein